MFRTIQEELSIKLVFNLLLYFDSIADLQSFLKKSTYSTYLCSAGIIILLLAFAET